MKKHYLIIGAIVIIVVVIVFFYYKKKKSNTLRQFVLSWANSDPNETSRSIRVAGVNALSDSDVTILADIVKNYFNTGTALTPDLQKWFDAASTTYHINGN